MKTSIKKLIVVVAIGTLVASMASSCGLQRVEAAQMDPVHVESLNDAMEELADTLGDESSQRIGTLSEALSFVGKISYNQASHGATLRKGGSNDSSGFVSRIWNERLGGRVFTTHMFKHAFRDQMRVCDDGNYKPGDIILKSNGDSNHVMIYANTSADGDVMVVDCTGAYGVSYRAVDVDGCSYISFGETKLK